jgi:hypothetical protein
MAAFGRQDPFAISEGRHQPPLTDEWSQSILNTPEPVSRGIRPKARPPPSRATASSDVTSQQELRQDVHLWGKPLLANDETENKNVLHHAYLSQHGKLATPYRQRGS